ncbi:MAG TPA: PorP/SprF family type IX secretion system membrane protein [Cytophagaceae bacterium]|jgi:type IX secretion system PorP/SprF family membrane protein
MVGYKNRYFLFFLLYIYHINYVDAQDIQFSQYYNLVHYQNPAFVGTSYAWRGVVHSRLQWPGSESRYLTSVVSLDYNYAKINSGLGAMFIYDDQGDGAIKATRGILQYAYRASLSPSLDLRGGVNLGYVGRRLDNDLYYPTQFNGSGFSQNLPSTTDQPTYFRSYIDIAAGVLLYSKSFWLGISSNHINEPNQSFMQGTDRIPRRFDFLTGYKIVLKSKPAMRYLEPEDEEIVALYPTVLYKFQGKSDQLDVGIYGIYDYLKLGVWYRGILIKNYNNTIPNHESIIFLAGFKIDNISFGYSYDFLISKLAPIAKGAHEFNLTILYPKRKNFKHKYKYKRLPCPDFFDSK